MYLEVRDMSRNFIPENMIEFCQTPNASNAYIPHKPRPFGIETVLLLMLALVVWNFRILEDHSGHYIVPLYGQEPTIALVKLRKAKNL